MSSSREDSPEWLRSFKVPTVLSSDSEFSKDDSPKMVDNIDSDKLPLRQFLQLSNKTRSGDLVMKEISQDSTEDILEKGSPEGQLGDVDPTLQNTKKTVNRKKGYQRLKKAKNDVSSEKQAPNASIWMLSSDSELSAENNSIEEAIGNDEKQSEQKASTYFERREGKDASFAEDYKESPSKKTLKGKTSKRQLKLEDPPDIEINIGNGRDVGTEDETFVKQRESHVSSSGLPLFLSEKVQRCKALVECEGDSIDLSGDMGAVGRVIISDTPSGNHEMFFDLKGAIDELTPVKHFDNFGLGLCSTSLNGTIYKTAIVPCRTFCVVSFGQSEAKIEALMNDFVQLCPQSSINEAETMVEGTLDGFSFDSDDEADKLPKATNNQGDLKDGAEGETNGKAKRKSEKTSGLSRKKGKSLGTKPQPPKKVRKKNQSSKRSTTKK